MADAREGKEPAPDAWSSAKSSIDFIVAVATVVYALGYLAWAIYSWRHRLDLPPVLEGQYVVAGIVPALLLLLLVIIAGWLRKLRAWLVAPAAESYQKRHQAFKNVGALFIVCGFLAMYLDTNEWIYSGLIWAGLVLMLLSLYWSSDKTDRLFARAVSWYGHGAAVVVAFALMWFYVERFFPYLPAEFGGPEVSCVRLDLKRGELSETVLKFLAPRISGKQPEMVHSRAVEMLSPPGRFYLIAVSNGDKTSFVKLNTEIVHAIVPSDECGILQPKNERGAKP